MAYRTFSDDAGRLWEAWDVVPRGIMLAAPERRMLAERRTGETRPTLVDDERRAIARRVAVTPGMEGGWLAFRSGHDRRRISPIPDEWSVWSDERLREECARATVIRGAGPTT